MGGGLIGIVCAAILASILLYKGSLTSIFNMYDIRYFTLWERLLTQPRVVIFYLSQIFYPIPTRLSITHDIDIYTSILQPWTTIPALLMVTLLIGAGILLMRKRPLISFGILFFFLTHLIESTILPIELIFEHRNYLPSLFLFLPIAAGCKLFLDFYKKQNRVIYLVGIYSLTLVIIGLGVGTYIRNLAWATEKTLWEDAMAKAPGMARPYQNLAWGYYAKIKNYPEAIRLYEHALNLKDPNPSYSANVSFSNVANLYLRNQDYEKSIAYCRRALEVHPNSMQAIKVLAYASYKSGRWEEAIKNIKLLYSKHYTNPKYMIALSFSLIKINEYEEALGYLKNGLRMEPHNSKIHYLIGVAMSRLQKYQRAEWFLQRAAQLAPNDISIPFFFVENSLLAGDQAGVERHLDRLFQHHSIRNIAILAKGIPDDALKVGFTAELLAPLIADRIKSKTAEFEQLAQTQSDHQVQSEDNTVGQLNLTTHEELFQK